MIYVKRDDSSKPAAFDKAVAQPKRRLQEFFTQSKSQRSQRKYRIELQTVRRFMPRLLKIFHGKCAFCETPLSADQGNVLWFRPRADAMDLQGKTDPEYYWWLAYEWSNLYPACSQCNRHKRSRFPVKGRRARVGSLGEELEKEQRLLLDPCQDKGIPFYYQPDGTIAPRTEQAEITVETFGLNRPQLVRDRHRVIEALGRKIESFQEIGKVPKAARSAAENRRFDSQRKGLDREAEAARPYAALRKQMVTAAKAQVFLGAVKSGVSEAFSGWLSKFRGDMDEVTAAADWITRIEIRNFKSIVDLDMSFPEGQSDTDTEPWLMLLGENGVGKSAILKAIALAFMDEQMLAEYLPDPVSAVYDRAKPRQATIRVHFNTLDEPLQLRFGRGIKGFEITGTRAPMSLLAYGATRLPPPIGEPHSAEPRRVRMENLFDPRASLSDAEPWLADTKRVDSSTFNNLARALRKLLSLDEAARITRKSGRLFVAQNQSWVPLREMSDGYQSVLALATDIMLNLATDWDSMSSAEGTVLLDEIEVHLHPKWKIEIVSCLRDVFPRVRFIVTTHDPLCLHGLHDGEIHRLFRDPETRQVRVLQMDIPKGVQIDQLLTGHWFGLVSTMDNDTRGLFEEYMALLRLKKRSAAKTARVETIRTELRKRTGGFAETSLERIALGAAADLMIEQKSRDDSVQWSPAKVRAQIYDVLKTKA